MKLNDKEALPLKLIREGSQFKDVSFLLHQGMSARCLNLWILQILPCAVLVVTGENGTERQHCAGLLLVLLSLIEVRSLLTEWIYVNYLRHGGSQLTYLPQDVQFLPASIRENLLAAVSYNSNLSESEQQTVVNLNKIIKDAGLYLLIKASRD